MLLFWSWLNNPASVTVLVTGVVGVGAVGNVTVSTNTTWTPVTDGTQAGWASMTVDPSPAWSTVATPNTTWNPVLV